MLPFLVGEPGRLLFGIGSDGLARASSADGLPRGGPSRLFCSFAVGTNNLHPAAWAGVNRQPEAVQLHDRGYQIHAKTHAGRISDLVGAIETPQHGLAF